MSEYLVIQRDLCECKREWLDLIWRNGGEHLGCTHCQDSKFTEKYIPLLDALTSFVTSTGDPVFGIRRK